MKFKRIKNMLVMTKMYGKFEEEAMTMTLTFTLIFLIVVQSWFFWKYLSSLYVRNANNAWKIWADNCGSNFNSLKIYFREYSLMMNSISRSLKLLFWSMFFVKIAALFKLLVLLFIVNSDCDFSYRRTTVISRDTLPLYF